MAAVAVLLYLNVSVSSLLPYALMNLNALMYLDARDVPPGPRMSVPFLCSSSACLSMALRSTATSSAI